MSSLFKILWLTGIWTTVDISVDGTMTDCSCYAPSSSDKINCGWKAISKSDCEDLGCCYKKVRRQFWCYHPTGIALPDEPVCEPALSNPGVRVKCGRKMVTREECECQGCCYDNSLWKMLWCFEPFTGRSDGNVEKVIMFLKKVVKAELWKRTMTGLPFRSLPIDHLAVVVTTTDGDKLLVHKGSDYLKRCDTVVVFQDVDGFMEDKWTFIAEKDVSVAIVQDYVNAGDDNFDEITDTCGNAIEDMMMLP